MSKDKKVQYPVRDGCLGLPLLGRFYNFNFSLASSQNLIKATANVILFLQI